MKTPLALRTAVCVCIMGLAAAVARGDGAATQPLPADEMLRNMLQPPAPTSRPQPAAPLPAAPLLPVKPHAPAAADLLREGSDVVDRTARLTDVHDGPLRQLVFDADAGAAPLPPMYVLPNLKLLAMETQLGATTRKSSFVVSGTVTEYHGHNYILLDSGPGSTMAAPLAPPPRSATTRPVAAEQMVHDLLGTPPSRPAANAAIPARSGPSVDARSGNGAVAPNAPVLTVLREDSQIIDRTGRLTPGNEGQLSEFAFDADASTMQDPPLVILPSLKLAAMESAVAGANKDLRFRVTGLVTEYRGRNYLLLQKAVVIPDNTQQF